MTRLSADLEADLHEVYGRHGHAPQTTTYLQHMRIVLERFADAGIPEPMLSLDGERGPVFVWQNKASLYFFYPAGHELSYRQTREFYAHVEPVNTRMVAAVKAIAVAECALPP